MKKTTNKNKTYEAPQLTVVSFKVEQGFAGSGSYFTHKKEFGQEVGTTFDRTGYGQESGSNQQSW